MAYLASEIPAIVLKWTFEGPHQSEQFVMGKGLIIW